MPYLLAGSHRRVNNTMTVNPVVSALHASQLLAEPITLNLGLVAVFTGLWLATTESRQHQIWENSN